MEAHQGAGRYEMSEQKDLRHEANLQGMRLLMASKDKRIAKLESLVTERDAMLGKRPCQNNRCKELNAARADLETARKRDEEWHEHTTHKWFELSEIIFDRDASRALLRELVAAIEDEQGAMGICEKAHSYLDACDNPGAPDVS